MNSPSDIDKVNQLIVHLRRQWPKYDIELTQNITGMDTILKLFQHFFAEAKLEKDHQDFESSTQGNIEELIYKSCGITAN
jgi:hypothetical protein